MCRGCVSTRIRLQDKGVNCPTNCESCDSANEDMADVMFVCPFAVQVWQMTGLAQEINAAVLTANSAADIVFQLLRMLSVELKQRLATVFWSLWKSQEFADLGEQD